MDREEIIKYFKQRYNKKIKIKFKNLIKNWQMGEREIIITNKGNYLIYYLANDEIKDVYKLLRNGQTKLMR